MNPVSKDEATAYRERWPAWANEVFKIEPVVDDKGKHHADIGCRTCEVTSTVVIDLRNDPAPALLREMRAHMQGHGIVPNAEKAR